MEVRTSVVALALLMAACAAPSTDSTSTTTTSALPGTTSSSTTTSTSTTTTTTAPGPVELARMGVFSNPVRAMPERTYEHAYSLVPVRFRFTESGWEFDAITTHIIGFTKVSGGVRVGGQLLFVPESAGLITEQILSHQTVQDQTEPISARLGGLAAMQFDVLVFEPIDALGTQFGCTGPVLVEDVDIDQIASFGGLPGCAWNRVWIASVSGGTIVAFLADVTLADDPPEELPENFAAIELIQPVITELEAAITIGG